MEAIPRNDGEQYRFDAFCKAVLRNEARNYHRNKKRLLDREKSFSVLSMEEPASMIKTLLRHARIQIEQAEKAHEHAPRQQVLSEAR